MKQSRTDKKRTRQSESTTTISSIVSAAGVSPAEAAVVKHLNATPGSNPKRRRMNQKAWAPKSMKKNTYDAFAAQIEQLQATGAVVDERGIVVRTTTQNLADFPEDVLFRVFATIGNDWEYHEDEVMRGKHRWAALKKMHTLRLVCRRWNSIIDCGRGLPRFYVRVRISAKPNLPVDGDVVVFLYGSKSRYPVRHIKIDDLAHTLRNFRATHKMVIQAVPLTVDVLRALQEVDLGAVRTIEWYDIPWTDDQDNVRAQLMEFMPRVAHCKLVHFSGPGYDEQVITENFMKALDLATGMTGEHREYTEEDLKKLASEQKHHMKRRKERNTQGKKGCYSRSRRAKCSDRFAGLKAVTLRDTNTIREQVAYISKYMKRLELGEEIEAEDEVKQQENEDRILVMTR